MEADVCILGAGPAGSTLARLLAVDGMDVLLVDRATGPQFKIGESLLPEGIMLCRAMGLDLDAHGFQPKFGVRFVLSDGDEDRFDFRDGGRAEEDGYAFEVKRAEFDAVLQRHAVDGGARLETGFLVESVDVDGVSVTARDGRTVRARYLVDATGPASLLGRRLGLREAIDGLKKAALFAHFDGVPRADGEPAGDIVIVHSATGWHWLIPFADGTTSVGVVGDPEFLRAQGTDDEERFDRLASQSEAHRQLLGARRALGPLQRAADFSFRCRTFSGERFVLLGDAAGFVDPIFSNGVFLAQKAAFLAHTWLGPALKAGALPDATARERYEAEMRIGLDRFLSLVRQFYGTAFVDNIVRTRTRRNLRRDLTSLLAGGVYDEENVWIRMGVI